MAASSWSWLMYCVMGDRSMFIVSVTGAGECCGPPILSLVLLGRTQVRGEAILGWVQHPG